MTQLHLTSVGCGSRGGSATAAGEGGVRFGDAAAALEVHLVCPNAMVAVVGLTGRGVPEPVRIMAYAAAGEEQIAGAWGTSELTVFR